MLNHSPAIHHPHFSVISVPAGEGKSKSALEPALGTASGGTASGTASGTGHDLGGATASGTGHDLGGEGDFGDRPGDGNGDRTASGIGGGGTGIGDRPWEIGLGDNRHWGQARTLGNEGTGSSDSMPVQVRFLELFEEITGWVVEFSESRSSLHRRQLAGSENEMADGSFSIVDMSAQWPAKIPTGHRGKCDEMIEMIEQMAGELHATRTELARTRSVLEGLKPGAVDDDVILEDSFVHSTSRMDVRSHEWGSDSWEAIPENDVESDDEFELAGEWVIADNVASEVPDSEEESEFGERAAVDFSVFQTIPAPAFLRSSAKSNQLNQTQESH